MLGVGVPEEGWEEVVVVEEEDEEEFEVVDGLVVLVIELEEIFVVEEDIEGVVVFMVDDDAGLDDVVEVVVVCFVEVEVGLGVMVVLIVLVVVLHVAWIFLEVHDDDAERVKVEVWPALEDFDVQLHDVMVDSLVDVTTAGAGTARATWDRLIAIMIWRKECMIGASKGDSYVQCKMRGRTDG